MKKNIYIGGSLFTDKQIQQRIQEENKIKENIKGVYVYNPITNDEINDKTKNPTPKDIFLQDTNKVITSHVITADLDDIDTGLAMELGVAYGCNYMREMFVNILKHINANMKEESKQEIIDTLTTIINNFPKKEVYATCSDIRQDTKGEVGAYKSWGQNQYVVGGIEEMGKIYRHFDEALKDMIKK